MIEGNQQMPLPGIDFTEGIGNNGPGAVRITFLSSIYIVLPTNKMIHIVLVYIFVCVY